MKNYLTWTLNLLLPFLLAGGMLLSGCAGKNQSYVDPDIGIGYVERIAVLPLENNTEAKFAADRVHDILATALLRQGYFKLVEEGEVQRFLREEIVTRDSTALDKDTGQKMAKALSIDAFVTGSVDDYSLVQNGPYGYWVVAATFRMVDARTGTIVWQASGTESGYRTLDRLFGFASEDVNRVTYRLINDLLGTMY